MTELDANDATPGSTRPERSGTPVSEQLWHDVHDRLTAFVAQRIDDPADVADLVQTVFLRVHQHAASIDDDDRLLPWLFQVTRNAIADHYRSPARRREVGRISAEGAVEVGGQSVESQASLDPAVGTDDATALAELSSCVRPMVEQLPDPYREALTLVEFQGLAQVEVATRLGISVSGMKSRVQRGRALLRDVLLACCEVSRSATGGVLDFVPRAGAGCAEPGCAPGPSGTTCGPGVAEHDGGVAPQPILRGAPHRRSLEGGTQLDR